jgi:hypothetical protein
MMILIEGITASRDWRLGVCPALPARTLHSRFRASNQFLHGAAECPLCGVERTLNECIATSQFDPPRTWSECAPVSFK